MFFQGHMRKKTYLDHFLRISLCYLMSNEYLKIPLENIKIVDKLRFTRDNCFEQKKKLIDAY